jgi:uncharacterized protein (DUF983 family)
MPAPPCPKCGATTVFAGYDPWCPSCGWNREEAGNRLRRAARKAPLFYIFAAVIFGVFFQAWRNPQPATLAIVFVLPLVPVLLLYASLRWSRKKYEAAVRDFEAGIRPAAPSQPARALSPAAGEFQSLLEMPRPRPVRVSRKGRSNLLIALAGVAAFDLIFLAHIWTAYKEAGSFQALPRADWMWLMLAVAMALIPYATWKNVKRQRALLETGEVALATILKQFGNRSTFSIQYEFRDAQGLKVTGLATDNTRSLYEGMNVPVFFDAQNPKQRVAQCESFCEVALPEKQ